MKSRILKTATYAGILGVVSLGLQVSGVSGNAWANDATPVRLQNDVGIDGLSGAAGADHNYFIEVPAGAKNLVMSISGDNGSGNADIYTAHERLPTTRNFQCRSWKAGNSDSCTVVSPTSGKYYIKVHGYSAYAGVTVKASYSMGGNDGAPGQGLVTDPDVIIPESKMPKPGYLAPYIDPAFHTEITRITGDEGKTYTDSEGRHEWGQYSIHHYSTVQPWNSDGSLIEVQVSGGDSVVFLNGNTYQPEYGKCPNYDYYDTRWNPAPGHENEQIDVSHGYLYWFNVATCTPVKTIKLPSTNMTFIGGGKGNVSRDGRYVVLANHLGDQETHPKVYLLDMLGTGTNGSPGRFGPALDVPTGDCLDDKHGCQLTWAGISPSGKYVIVHYKNDYTRVYDVNLDTLKLSVHPMPGNSPECPSITKDGVSNAKKSAAKGYIFDTGHADMTINPADGEDVIVGTRRGWCKKIDGVTQGQVVMVRLKDNRVTSLTNPVDEEYSYHVSARNIRLPGWVYVSYQNPIDKNTLDKNGRPWARFTDEVVAISLDSRRDHQIVRRLAHLHSSGIPYHNEAHAVPSSDGKRVIFASAWDWGCDRNNAGCGVPRSANNSVQDYVIDLRDSDTGPTPPPPGDGGPDSLQNGVPVTGISGARHSKKYYTVTAPPGSLVTISTSGGTGNVNLYVSYDRDPTTRNFNCGPDKTGNNETCSRRGRTGKFRVLLYGSSKYSGIELKANW